MERATPFNLPTGRRPASGNSSQKPETVPKERPGSRGDADGQRHAGTGLPGGARRSDDTGGGAGGGGIHHGQRQRVPHQRTGHSPAGKPPAGLHSQPGAPAPVTTKQGHRMSPTGKCRLLQKDRQGRHGDGRVNRRIKTPICKGLNPGTQRACRRQTPPQAAPAVWTGPRQEGPDSAACPVRVRASGVGRSPASIVPVTHQHQPF